MLPDYIEYLMSGAQNITKLSNTDEDNIFRGLLIKPGEWKGYTYTTDELKSAIPTLIGKMITLDHDDRFDSHVGVITNAFWDDNLNGIVIDFKIIDPAISKKLNNMAKESLLNQVGLSAELAYTTITNNDKEVKGIMFKKATLTFYPAVRGARLITKLSEDKYNINIIEQKDDGSLIAELIPIENLDNKKDNKYPYPAPDKAAGYPYPVPQGYPIPPDEWKAVKDAIADLQKRVDALEKKLVKQSEVENSSNSNNSKEKINTEELSENDTTNSSTEKTDIDVNDNKKVSNPSSQPVQNQPTSSSPSSSQETVKTVAIEKPVEVKDNKQTISTDNTKQTQEPLKIQPDIPVKEEPEINVEDVLKELSEKARWDELSEDTKKKLNEIYKEYARSLLNS